MSRLERLRRRREALLRAKRGETEPRRIRWGRWVTGLAVGTWAYVLFGFVSLPMLVLLSLLGPLLLRGSLYLGFAAERPRLAGPVWPLGASALGLLLLAGAAATLVAGAPERFLVDTATGWRVLERRATLLGQAIDEDDVRLARSLVSRGLGDTAPRGSNGRPLIHDVRGAPMLAALLEGGLDPEVQDLDGATLLFDTRDVEVTRVLLEAGADPNRTRTGVSLLTASLDKDPAIVALLRQAGARESAYDGDDAEAARGRADWLVAQRDPAAAPPPSAVTLDHRPLQHGDVATLDIRLSNDSAEDRRLHVEAHLSVAAFFVGASHGGAIANPTQPQMSQTIRWPRLWLPAQSQGRLELALVASSERDAGDFVVDVRVRDWPGVGEVELLQVIERPRGPHHDAAAAGGWGPSWLPFAPLGLALAFWMTRLAVRRRSAAARRLAMRAWAGLAALLCLALVGVLSWSAARPFTHFEAAHCTVLDRRLRMRHTQTSSSTGTSTGARSTPYLTPLVAVRIDDGSPERIETGFATGLAVSPHELKFFPLGDATCWVDPANPSAFTLVRRPSVGSVALTGVLLLTGTVFAVVAVRRRNTAE